MLVVLAMSVPASAQTAEAETLFREAKKLAKRGKTAEACAKFEASERLEANVTTELNLGKCHAKLGQTASAWINYVKAAATAKRADIKDAADEAKKRAAALEKVLVRLTISVPNPIDGLVIRRNQTSIDRELWNQEVPVDPDDYTISAEAPDYIGWSVTVAVKTKSKVVEVPKLERDPHAAEPVKPPKVVEPPVERPPPRADVVQPEPPPVPPARGNANTTVVVALGAVGVGALAIGTGFGLYSSHLASEADATCPTIQCPNADAVDQNHAARAYGWIANISWGIGAVSLVSAAAKWWLGRPSDAVTVVPTGGRDTAGLALEGRF